MTTALQQDIERRELAEEDIRKLNDDLTYNVRQLEESNRELDAFSYSVSHDLRTPLRGIDGFSVALIEDHGDKLDAQGREYLDRIRSATQRMSQLIDDLLKLSRVARFEMKRDRVDLSAVAAGLASSFKKNDTGRSVEFRIAAGISAIGDIPLLTIVLENLFANAWKFTENNPHAVIEFGSAKNRARSNRMEDGVKAGATVCFVRDNGAGFDMTYVDKLFNPFQRLHKEAEFPGHGIGLATVKRIIDRHGGRVWIESEVGKGTTVYFAV